MNSNGSPEDVETLIAGRYRVKELLGRGGMAVVYRVTDERTGKDLAVKRCFARDQNKLKRYAALLEREYYTLTQLAHPHIIAVYDYGFDALGPYYTMELLDGKDLEQVDKLSWPEVCAVLCDVGSSLAMLHSRGFVHRDVTLRNIHYARDGRVKLMDFGAMVSMGVARDTVGTPAFLAPEALQMQALDARVDLFSLGALGYRLLTGRHAFAARRFSELRDVWRSRPQAPHMVVPDIPAGLSALVLRLLTLDRGGRPQTAAEVIDQLERLAGIEHENIQMVSRAYLTAPTLVGRENALLAVRRRMLQLVRGEGGVLLMRGAPGSGRSRLLDACALEGKLLGASIVRADTRDAANGDWGVAKAIGTQLFDMLPEQALEAARLSRHVLGPLIEPLREEESLHTNTTTMMGDLPERAVLIRELRDWVLALIKQQRLLIIVDDIDRIDDGSLAFLSALAHRAPRHHLLIVGAIEHNEQGQSKVSVRLLDELAQHIDVAALSASEAEALMRSVFGDITNLSACSSRIFGLSNGNPRAAMALAQHLVDTGRARYDAGQWELPDKLEENDLPKTLADSLAAQLRELSADARELAESLAVADGSGIELASYGRLTSHGDNKRLFGALNELCGAGLMSAGPERYTFVQRSCLAVLQDGMDHARRVDTHVRVARLLAMRGSDALQRAHHLLEAELSDDAVELLATLDLTARAVPIPLLMKAISEAERLQYPGSTVHRLRMAVLVHAPSYMAYDSFRQVLPIVLAQLERDSGLARYRELADLPDDERLKQALAQTQQAHLDAPPEQRVLTVIDAIRELSRLYGALPAMAAPIFDIGLLDSVPSLEPLFPLSPALPVISQLLAGGREWIRGRAVHALKLFRDVLARISQPDRAGLDDAQHERTRLGIEYALGLIEARLGIEQAEQRARTLEQQPLFRVNALRVRTILQLAIGNVIEARKHQRRAELLQAQQGAVERFGATTVSVELLMYARIGDAKSVQGQLPAIAALARQHRSWRPVDLLARGRFAELQGDLPGALALVQAGLADSPALEHPFYMILASCEVRLLADSGRVLEATERARAHLDFTAEHGIPAWDLEQEAATAFSKANRFSDAVRMLDTLIVEHERQGSVGLSLGTLYEARARVAIRMRDNSGFEKAATSAGREFEKAQNPDLSARLSQLFDEAQQQGVFAGSDTLATMELMIPTLAESQFESIHTRLAECLDASDRARVALTLLLQSTFGTLGYLYGVDADCAVSLLASLPEPSKDPRLGVWVTQCVNDWAATYESIETVDATRSGTHSDETMEAGDHAVYRYSDAEGRNMEAALLTDTTGGVCNLVAVLVMHTPAQNRSLPPEHLRRTLAHALSEHGDVRGISLPSN
ncbi:MAG: hypothetical protein RL701_7343 [Pseudomonadota bacterium]